MPYVVGDKILCNGKQATVRFVGTTEFAAGVWLGVEFSKHAAGKNNGSVQGVSYFGPCEANYGLFLKEDSQSISSYSAEAEAATKLQAQVRRHQSAETTAYEQANKAFNAMENQTEREYLRINANTARAEAILAREGQAAVEKRPEFAPKKRSSGEVPDDESARIALGGTEAGSVAGSAAQAVPALRAAAIGNLANPPGIDFQTSPLGGPAVSRESVDNVVAHFKRNPGVNLPADVVKALIRRTLERFRLDVTSAVVELATPEPPGRLLVLGDTHGQLNDVFWIFFEHGEPSRDNVYLFNGDVVDRGGGAVEILMTIFLYKLWEPGCIHLNRGNHEDPGMNENYGFKDECVRKWGSANGLEIFEMFNEFFQFLPLYTVIDEKVFVVHGGLWRNRIYHMDTLRQVDYKRACPTNSSKGFDFLFADALWSDPQEPKGIGGNSRGDQIISFGPDITNRFLERNKFRLLIRSHQLPFDGYGYEWWHGQKCLTIFSASNYCGECGNFGAVLILCRGEPDQLVEFYAPSIEEVVELENDHDRALTRVKIHAQGIEKQRKFRRKAAQHMIDSVVLKVQELVAQNRMELFEYWTTLDKSPPGVFLISAATWRDGCAAVLDPDVPWLKVQEAMCVAGNTGEVHYIQFLTRYRVAYDAGTETSVAGWEAAIWSRIMEMLLRADLPLREALAAIDSTNDGLVSVREFGRLLESCQAGISALQARKMLQTIASQGCEGNKVNLWDLLQRLQVTLPIAPSNTDESSAWIIKALRPLASTVLDDSSRRLVPAEDNMADWPASRLLAMWFEDADVSGNGYLEYSEYVDALKKLRPNLGLNGCPDSDEELESIAKYCDVLANGCINYFELLNGLTWGDSLGPDLKEDMLQGIHSTIYFNRTVIRHAMEKFDIAKSGIVQPTQFAQALQAVYTALTVSEAGEELTKMQIDTIAESLPRDPGPSGGINYVSFLDSFRVVDARDELTADG